MQCPAGRNDGLPGLVEDRTASDNSQGDVLSARDLVRIAAESQQELSVPGSPAVPARDTGAAGERDVRESEVPGTAGARGCVSKVLVTATR